MNIFVLDETPQLCAKYHADAHVVKMILETAQLLCSAVQLVSEPDSSLYKITHQNHPSAIWTRASLENFLWLTELGLYLGEEYTFRYGKTHKSIDMILKSFEHRGVQNLPDIPMTPFAVAMPDELKTSDAVESYRNYYQTEKRHLAKWTKRGTPHWYR